MRWTILTMSRAVTGPMRLALIGVSAFGLGALMVGFALNSQDHGTVMALFPLGTILAIAGAVILIGAAIDAWRGRSR